MTLPSETRPRRSTSHPRKKAPCPAAEAADAAAAAAVPAPAAGRVMANDPQAYQAVPAPIEPAAQPYAYGEPTSYSAPTAPPCNTGGAPLTVEALRPRARCPARSAPTRGSAV